MTRPLRTAAILTLSFTFIALWIAFVTTGDEPLRPAGLQRWLLSVATTLFLIGTLFLAGLVTASAQEAGASMAIAALVAVGALLGLVPSLRAVLWGGPAWLRWAIVGLATTTVLIGSGRATGYAALGGLIWSAVGAWIGVDRDLAARIDLTLTGLMVGTTVGAVGGTLWLAGRGRDWKGK